MNVTTMMVMIGANTVGLNKGISDIYRAKRAISVAANGMNQSLMSTNLMLDKTNMSMQRLKANADLTSISIANLGRTLTMFVSVPIGLLGVAATKVFSEVEFNLSKVVGLVGVAAEQTAQWKTEMNALSTTTGKGPKELSEALYYITTGGIRGAETMEVMSVSAKAAATGLGEVKDIADVLVSAMNAYGKENLNAAAAADILVKSVKEGKAEANELVNAFGVVTPVASKLGITYDQVGAGLAAMTRTGTTAATSATQLRRILFTLLKPTQQVEQALHQMGTTSQEMRNIFRFEGLLPGLLEIQRLTSQWGEEMMGRVFPNIRAFAGAVDILGENLSKNREIFDSIANSTGALNKAFSVVSETFKFKLNVALSKGRVTLENIGAVVAKHLIPVIERFGNAAKSLGDWFTSLSPTLQNLIVRFSGIVLAIGPIIMILKGIQSILIPVGHLFLNLSKIKFTSFLGQLTLVSSAQRKMNDLALQQSIIMQKQAAAEAARMDALIAKTKAFNAEYMRRSTVVTSSAVIGAKARNLGDAATAAEIKAQNAQKIGLLTKLDQAEKRHATTTIATIRAQELATSSKKALTLAQIQAVRATERLAVTQLVYAAAKSKANLTDALGLRTATSLTGAYTRNNKIVTVQMELRKAELIARRSEIALKKATNSLTAHENELNVLKNKLIVDTNALTAIRNKVEKEKLAISIKQQRAAALEIAAMRARAAALEIETIAAKQAAFAKASLYTTGNKISTGFLISQSKAVNNAQLAGMMTAANYAKKQKELAAQTAITGKVAVDASKHWAAFANGLAMIPKIPVLIALVGVYLILRKLFKQANELTAAQKALNASREEAAASISAEVGKINAYMKIAEDERINKELRLEAINNLKEVSPAYFGLLDLETVKTDKAREAVEAYNTALSNRAKLIAAQKGLEENEAAYLKDVISGADTKVSWGQKFKIAATLADPEAFIRDMFEMDLNKPTFGGGQQHGAYNKKVEEQASKNAEKRRKDYEDTAEAFKQSLMDRTGVMEDMTKQYNYLSTTVQQVHDKELEISELSKTRNKENAKAIDAEILKQQKLVDSYYEQISALHKMASADKAFIESITNHWATPQQAQMLEQINTILAFTTHQLELFKKIKKDDAITDINTELQTLFATLRDGLQTVENLDKIGMFDTFDSKVSEKMGLIENAIKGLVDASKSLMSVNNKKVTQLKNQLDVYKVFLDVSKQTETNTKTWADANEYWVNEAIEMDMVAKKLGTTVSNLKNEFGIGVVNVEYLRNLSDFTDYLDNADSALLQLNVRTENMGGSFNWASERLKILNKLLDVASEKGFEFTDELRARIRKYTEESLQALIDTVQTSLSMDLADFNSKLSTFGNLWSGVSTKVKMYESALESLMAVQNNVAISGTKAFEEWIKKVEELRNKLIQLSPEIIAEGLEKINVQAYLTGQSFDTLGATINLLTNEFERLWDLGLRPGDQALDALMEPIKNLNAFNDLKDTFSALGSAINEVKDALDRPAENWTDWVITLLGNMPKILGMFDSLIAITALDTLAKEANAKASKKATQQKMLEAGANALNAATSSASAVASGTEAAADAGAAIAGATKSGAKLPPPFNIAAIAAGVGAVIAAIATIPKVKKATKMARGGIVPAGYPNDSYPAMLTSGEAVVPPHKLPDFERQPVEVKVTVEGKTKGKDLYYIVKEMERIYQNSY